MSPYIAYKPMTDTYKYFFFLLVSFGRKKELDDKDNILKAYLKKIRTHSKKKKALISNNVSRKINHKKVERKKLTRQSRCEDNSNNRYRNYLHLISVKQDNGNKLQLARDG